jgi:GAF domain-containing protein
VTANPQQPASSGVVPISQHITGEAVDHERDRAGRREQAVIGAFVDLAAGLVGDVDVHDALTRLAEHLIDIVDADACGIMLLDSRQQLGIAAAVPRTIRDLEAFQLEVDDGPCLECARSGRPVHSADLVVDAPRWPRWAALAVDAGFPSVDAAPLRYGDHLIGTLNLFSRTARAMDESDLRVVNAFADVVGIAIVQHRDTTNAGILTTQLQGALTSRIIVEQAKGVLIQALQVQPDRAFAILRHNARNTNSKLTVLAGYVVDGRVGPTDLLLPPDESGPPTA